jgi:hypothetical protein
MRDKLDWKGQIAPDIGTLLNPRTVLDFSRNWLDFLKSRILLDWKRTPERTPIGIKSPD